MPAGADYLLLIVCQNRRGRMLQLRWLGMGCSPADSARPRGGHLPGGVLAGPKPAKGARGQHAIDESIDDFLDGHAPGLTLPDAVAQVSQTVGQECRGAGDAKDGQIVRAVRNRASGEIRDEEADNQAIGEPHAQELRHGWWAAGKDGHHPDRPLIVFFDHGGRLHFHVRAKRKHVQSALQAGAAQRSEELVFIGEPLVVAAVVRQERSPSMPWPACCPMR